MAGQRATSEAASAAGFYVENFVRDANLRRLVDYWCAKRQGRLMPSRDDIDPLDIGWALSRIFLVDYDPATGLVYRLAGGEVAGVFGRGNLKGLQARDFLPPDRAGAIEAAFLRVVEGPAVMVMRGMVYLRAGRLPMGERVFLPLADRDSNKANGVLGMTVVQAEPPESPAEIMHAEPAYIPVSSIP